jgi:hypothetical protein
MQWPGLLIPSHNPIRCRPLIVARIASALLRKLHHRFAAVAGLCLKAVKAGIIFVGTALFSRKNSESRALQWLMILN